MWRRDGGLIFWNPPCWRSNIGSERQSDEHSTISEWFSIFMFLLPSLSLSCFPSRREKVKEFFFFLLLVGEPTFQSDLSHIGDLSSLPLFPPQPTTQHFFVFFSDLTFPFYKMLHCFAFWLHFLLLFDLIIIIIIHHQWCWRKQQFPISLQWLVIVHRRRRAKHVLWMLLLLCCQ